MLNPKRFAHTAKDTWRWSHATGADVEEIIALVMKDYAEDSKNLWPLNPVEGSRNLMLAIVNQMYDPKTEFVSIARDQKTNKLLAFTWAKRDQRMTWSTEEMSVVQMASIDLSLGTKQRVRLFFQMCEFWERWCDVCKIRMIATSNVRLDWEPLMYLLDQAGYHVRGSLAWKRLNIKTIATEEPVRMVDQLNHATTTYNPADYNQAAREHSINSKEFRVE